MITVVIEWTAAICIGLLGFVILLPRIFLRHRMSVPLYPLQRQNQPGRLNVGYREIASKNGVVSVWYPCERTGSERRHDKVISTTVNVGKIMYSMTGIKLFLFRTYLYLSQVLLCTYIPKSLNRQNRSAHNIGDFDEYNL